MLFCSWRSFRDLPKSASPLPTTPASVSCHSFQREIGYLTAHSVLHLLGYDHVEKLEKVRMREKEELVMEQLGLPASSSYILDI